MRLHSCDKADVVSALPGELINNTVTDPYDRNVELAPEQIELINVHGPFDHSVWRAGETIITSEQALTGRAEFLAKTVQDMILGRIDRSQIPFKSLLDVGCYDGWLIEQGLAQLPFRRIVGVDPRTKNLEKGRQVREILNLPTRAEYCCAGIDTLDQEVFDVVVCTGLLHHLESVGEALRSLRAVTRGVLCLETLILPSSHITRELVRDLELKDIVYKVHELQCGITGQKLESSYYDGSAQELSVVSIPSLDSIQMYLETAGFGDIRISAEYEAPRTSYRSWKAVCLSAIPVNRPDESSLIAEYELGLLERLLDPSIVEHLYGLIGSSDLDAALREIDVPTDVYGRDIVESLAYSPDDKIALEYGKILLRTDPQKAIPILELVTKRLNADWRAVYRSHYVLSLAYEALGLDQEANRHRALCLTANPRYPCQ